MAKLVAEFGYYCSGAIKKNTIAQAITFHEVWVRENERAGKRERERERERERGERVSEEKEREEGREGGRKIA